MRTARHAPLWRRLLAWIYDALVVLAILFVGSFVVLPLTGGRAVAAGNPAYQAWLAMLVALYFVGSWRFGGQTLGMRAWRLRVTDRAGLRPSWRALWLRVVLAAVSALPLLGYLLCLFRSDRQAPHDLGSGTLTVLLDKEAG